MAELAMRPARRAAGHDQKRMSMPSAGADRSDHGRGNVFKSFIAHVHGVHGAALGVGSRQASVRRRVRYQVSQEVAQRWGD